jgi:hypothetical protein
MPTRTTRTTTTTKQSLEPVELRSRLKINFYIKRTAEIQAFQRCMACLYHIVLSYLKLTFLKERASNIRKNPQKIPQKYHFLKSANFLVNLKKKLCENANTLQKNYLIDIWNWFRKSGGNDQKEFLHHGY